MSDSVLGAGEATAKTEPVLALKLLPAEVLRRCLLNEWTYSYLVKRDTEAQRGKMPGPRGFLPPCPHLFLLHFFLTTSAAMRRNSKRKKKRRRRKCGGFSLFLHNVKKIAFANYRSLKAIRVFGGDSGHEQKRQSEHPAQNFSSIRLYQAKGGKRC